MADQILSQKQLSALCSSMAMLLRSGASVQEAAALYAQDPENPELKQASEALRMQMEQGSSFAEAAEQTGMFPAYALSVISAAELSGRLDESLERLAEYYDRQKRLEDRLRTTLTYPAVLLLMMCGVLAVLVFAVMPMFQRVYTSMTGSLLASSYSYVLAAAVIGRVSLALAAVVCLALVTVMVEMRRESGRQRLHVKMNRSRLTRRGAWLLAVCQCTDMLSSLLSSGMNEDDAVDFCIGQVQHETLKSTLEECQTEMQQGSSMAQAMFRHHVLPALYGRMLVGGAESGNLSNVMEGISSRLEQEVEMELNGLIDRTEPILIGFLTLSVGFTLLSVMLPLLGILNAV